MAGSRRYSSRRGVTKSFTFRKKNEVLTQHKDGRPKRPGATRLALVWILIDVCTSSLTSRILLNIANLLAWRPLSGTAFYLEIRRIPSKRGISEGNAFKKSMFRPLWEPYLTARATCGSSSINTTNAESLQILVCVGISNTYCTQ